MNAAKRRTHAAPGSWLWFGRPVTCRELVGAMYRAGQTRREVCSRLDAMGRWSAVVVRETAYKVAQEMGLVFGYGGGALVRKAAPCGARIAARERLRGQSPDVRRRYLLLKRYGVETFEALRALDL